MVKNQRPTKGLLREILVAQELFEGPYTSPETQNPKTCLGTLEGSILGTQEHFRELFGEFGGPEMFEPR